MPIDPSIALSIKPVQIQDPLNRMAAMMQLEGGQQSQQLNALKIKEAERELTENEGIRNYLAGANLNTPEGRAGLRQYGKTGLTYEKLLADQEKAGLERKELSGKINKQEMDRNNQNLRNLSRNPSDANIQAYFEDFVLDNPNETRKIENAQRTRDYLLSADIPTRNAYLSSLGATAGDLKPTIKDTDIGGSILPRVFDPYSGAQISQGTPIKKTATPGELLVDKRARDRLNAELQSTGTLTPAAIDVAAQIYIQTGQLPALGIGKSAGNLKSSILNRATQLYGNPAGAAPSVNAPAETSTAPPFNAQDMASQIVGNRIDVATKTKAAKDFSTGIQGRQVTAFNTAIDHLATMDKLSDALQNNDIKAFNYLGNLVAKQTGQPAPVNFDAAKQIVTAEIIKAVVASGGGVRERQEAEANFSTANSPAQLKGAINTYMQLLGGQLNSLGLQYENTTGRTDFDKKLTGDAKKAFKSVREQHNASGLPPGVGANWQLMQDGNGNKAYVNPANPKEIIEVK
jgi:hypothetical protein